MQAFSEAFRRLRGTWTGGGTLVCVGMEVCVPDHCRPSCAPACSSDDAQTSFRRGLREKEKAVVRTGPWWWFGIRCCSCAALGGGRDMRAARWDEPQHPRAVMADSDLNGAS